MINPEELNQVFGSLTFYVTAFVSLIAIGFILHTLNVRRQHASMSIITNTTAIVNFAMYLITALIAVSYSRYKFSNFESVDEQTIFAITYAIYFFLWIMANNYFMSQIARIPQSRRTQFTVIKWILRIEIIFLIIPILISSLPKSSSTLVYRVSRLSASRDGCSVPVFYVLLIGI